MPRLAARLTTPLVIGMLLIASSGAFAQPAFRIAYNESTAALVPLIRAVYREIGMQPEFLLLPSERAITGTNRGDYDADLSRAGGSIDAYSQLMQTAEPLRKTELYAYGIKGSKIVIRNAEDLKRHSLGLLLGAKLAEDFTRHENLVAQRAHSAAALHAMLAAGRFEVALVTSIQVAAHSASLNLHAQRISGPLTTGYSYHVLNKRHAALAPKFDAALLALKRTGQADRLLAPTLTQPSDAPSKASPQDD